MQGIHWLQQERLYQARYSVYMPRLGLSAAVLRVAVGC